jgi:hypothetical protein
VNYPQPRRIVLSNGGDYALSYSPLAPRQTTVSLLKGGKPLISVKLDGPITAGAISPDGTLAAAVTRNRRICLFRKKGNTFVASRSRLSASPRALLVPASNEVVIGYRGIGGVETLDGRGHHQWKLQGQARTVYDPYSSLDGKAIGVLSYRSGTGDRARVYVMSPNGTVLWQDHLPGIFPRMALESEATGAAVGYTEVYSGATTRYGRKIVYYDGKGHRLWEKGGVFFSPTLVATVSPGPAVMVRGPQMNFYTLDSRGAIRGLFTSPVVSLRTEASRNGRMLAVWDKDGILRCLQWKGD